MLLDESFEEDRRSEQLSDRDVFTQIWLSPRKVFRFINDYGYEKYMFVLLFAGGVGSALDRAVRQSTGDTVELLEILFAAIVAGGLVGFIGYLIFAGLTSWTGKWLNGRASTRAILRVSAYSMLPSIAALVLWIPQLAMFGISVFRSDLYMEEHGVLVMAVFYGTVVVESILGIWNLVLFIVGLSVVQKFSIGKAILNAFLPVLMIVLIALFVVMIVRGMF